MTGCQNYAGPLVCTQGNGFQTPSEYVRRFQKETELLNWIYRQNKLPSVKTLGVLWLGKEDLFAFTR